MPKPKRWIQVHRHEYYYKKAKREGYQSRAAFKLLDIQKKHDIFKPGQRVLDLCCAPGGWLQVIRELIGENGQILGIDLARTRSIANATLITADITANDILDKIKGAGFEKVDVIVSDCAPKTSGIKELDLARQHFLVEQVFTLSNSLLMKSGSLVCKIFQGGDHEHLVSIARQMFQRIAFAKPPSSNLQSREIYMVGLSFLQPPISQQLPTNGENPY